jgi:pimeloyl-ACP methyl ester carboxylesterase
MLRLLRFLGLLILMTLSVAGGDTLSRTNLLVYLDGGAHAQPVHRKSEWAYRRIEVLHAMQRVMGPQPGKEKRCALNVEIMEEVDCGSYVRRFLYYNSEPGSRVPAYLLIPKECLKTGARRFGILCLHQTHPAGQKVVVGLGQSPNDEYGVELVKRGYVCIAPANPLLANYAPDLKGLGYESGSMKAIWDNIRALDLLDELPFVRKGKFGAIGHSLGGHNALFTAAFEPRIQVVVTSCGFDSFADYMKGNIRGWTSERYMPNLLKYSAEERPFDFAEVISALAPRTCFVNAPVRDANFSARSVDAVISNARPVYKLLHSEARLIVEHPECEHSFPPEVRQHAYVLLDRVFGH